MTPGTPDALAEELAQALDRPVVRLSRVSGGDIHDAYCATLSGDDRVFVKGGDAALPGMFEAEARGLAWLGEPGALRTPRVLAATPKLLALEWIERAPPARGHDEALGRGLALLHRESPGTFGAADGRDNYLATLPQRNTPASSWPGFYAECRLLPLARRAEAQGHLDADGRRVIERLCARLPELVGPDEPPARLHGDLWSGNAMTDERGAPVLVDPAAYGGHREIDLAMMRLFGGFSARVFAAYDEAWPLTPGHEARVPLYQLYPLLAHVCLFGSGYTSAVLRAAARYA